jgi:hypothetical protein
MVLATGKGESDFTLFLYFVKFFEMLDSSNACTCAIEIKLTPKIVGDSENSAYWTHRSPKQQ